MAFESLSGGNHMISALSMLASVAQQGEARFLANEAVVDGFSWSDLVIAAIVRRFVTAS